MIKKKGESEIQKNRPKFTHRVSGFERSVKKAGNWIFEMHRNLEWMDADSVYSILRATLQSLVGVALNAIFNRMSPGEIEDVMASLKPSQSTLN